MSSREPNTAPVFDIEPWIARYPCHDVSSPFPNVSGDEYESVLAARYEQYRRRAVASGDLEASHPTDIFVLLRGEPDQRDTTKLRGLPYRPRGLPWPLHECTPMAFMAQFRFAESHDLVGPTPGEILLVFAAKPAEVTIGEPQHRLVFEWYPLGIEDLASVEEIPALSKSQDWGDPGGSSWGARFRTFDSERLYPPPLPRDPSDSDSVIREWRHLHSKYNGMKIGGLASNYIYQPEAAETFLGQFGEHWSNDLRGELHSVLTNMDGFTICLWLQANGSVHWKIHWQQE